MATYAALCFYNLYATYLRKLGFTQSKSDLCLFILKNDWNEVIMLVSCHVDDTQITGTVETLTWFKNALKERFNIKDLGKV